MQINVGLDTVLLRSWWTGVIVYHGFYSIMIHVFNLAFMLHYDFNTKCGEGKVKL